MNSIPPGFEKVLTGAKPVAEPFEIDGEVVTHMYPDGTVRTEGNRHFYWKADPRVEPHLPSMGGAWCEQRLHGSRAFRIR